MGTRTLVFVRHGQYAPEDEGRLTETGRRQAEHTAKWLKESLDQPIDVLWSSTLPRAKETAGFVEDVFGGPKARPVAVLCEGIYTKLRGYDVSAEEQKADRERADAAFEKLFKKTRVDRLEVVVCHGNLIRYLVCKAMRIAVTRWTRLNSSHCGVTRVLIRDTGAIRIVTYNETAHLPRTLLT
jgi:serine/threonine-protein phosphatase PGAM5